MPQFCMIGMSNKKSLEIAIINDQKSRKNLKRRTKNWKAASLEAG